jgi:hypothetical protein
MRKGEREGRGQDPATRNSHVVRELLRLCRRLGMSGRECRAEHLSTLSMDPNGSCAYGLGKRREEVGGRRASCWVVL